MVTEPPVPDPPRSLKVEDGPLQGPQLLSSEFVANKVVTQLNYMVIER